MGALTLGPFVLSLDRATAALGFAVLILGAEIWARRTGRPEIAAWAFTATWVVFAFARVGFVATNWASFAPAPATAFAFWQGGFAPWWGVVAGAAFTAWRLRTSPALRRAAPGLAVAATLAWLIPSGLTSSAVTNADVRLPDVTLPALAGGSVALAAVGEPTIVNVWATWCPPCRRELPLLVGAAERSVGVRIWLVNQRESAQVVERYLASANLPTDGVLLDGGGAIGAHFDVAGLPTTLAFDAQGALVDVHVGELSAAALATLIAVAQGSR